MICDAYESGVGHGLQRDGLDGSTTPFGDKECQEAYELGYIEGLDKSRRCVGPVILDRNELRLIANDAFAETVDWDFVGNPITNFDVLINGAYGPAVARLCNLVLHKYGESNVAFPIPEDESGLVKAVEQTKRMNGPVANEARRAMFALLAQVDEAIAQDITKKVYAAFQEIAQR